MDMAVNVWEGMENWYDKVKDTCSFRGGSWPDGEGALRASVSVQASTASGALVFA